MVGLNLSKFGFLKLFFLILRNAPIATKLTGSLALLESLVLFESEPLSPVFFLAKGWQVRTVGLNSAKFGF